MRRWWRPAAKAETEAHARMASALLTAPAVTVRVDATISEAPDDAIGRANVKDVIEDSL